MLFLRSFGAGAFVRLRDRTGELQLYCQEPVLGASTYTLTNDAIENRPGGETRDLGSILGSIFGK